MGGGTLGVADIYGRPSRPGGIFDPLSIQNPNGDSVAPPATQAASGGSAAVGAAPAISLVGLVVAIVILRVLIGLARD